MKNYKRVGAIRTYKNSAAVVSGQPIAIGERAGVATGSYDANQEGEYLMGGVCEFKKKAGLAISVGVSYSYDADAGEVVEASDANADFALGEADAAAAAGDETCFILVNKTPYAMN